MIRRIIKICAALFVAFFLTLGGAVIYVKVYKTEIEARISQKLTAQLGKPVIVTDVGSYFGLRALGLTLASVAFDQSHVRRITVEVNPLASLLQASLVVSHVEVQEARIVLTSEMLAAGTGAGEKTPEQEPGSDGATLDFATVIGPVNRVSALFRQISVANVSVEGPVLAAPVRLERLTLSKPNDGRLLQADLRHQESSLHLEIDLQTTPAQIEIRRIELTSKDLVVTPDLQLWLPPGQRHLPPPVSELHLKASGIASGHVAKLDLNQLKLKTAFVDIAVKGEAEFNSSAKSLTYKVGGQVHDIGLSVLDFLPSGTLDAKTVSLLQDGVKGLQISNGSLSAAGDLTGLASLDLKIAVAAESVTFDPAWPPVTSLNADVALTLHDLDVVLRHAGFQQLTLKQATARIEDFSNPRLTARFRFAEELTAVVSALAATPLQPKLADIARKANVTAGAFDLDLEVTAELTTGTIAPKITGQAVLTGVGIDIVAPSVQVRNFSGTLTFRPDFVASDNLKFDINGEPATLKFSHDDRTRPGQTDLLLDTKISVGLLKTLADRTPEPYLTGRSDYTLSAKVQHKRTGPELQARLKSNLLGTSVRLQGIYEKKAAEQSGFLLTVDTAGASTDTVLTLGDLIARAKIESGKSTKFGARMGVGKVPQPEPGRLVVDLPAVAGDITFNEQFRDIRARFSKLHIVTGEEDPNRPTGDQGASPPTAPSPTPTTAPPPSADTPPEKKPPLDPRTLPTIDLTVDDLRIGYRQFERVEILTTRSGDGLEIRKLNVEAGTFSQYNTRGTWLFNDGMPKVQVNSFFYFRDAGQALKNLGLYQNLSGIKGSVPVQVTLINPVAGGDRSLDLLVAFDLHSGRVRNINNVFLDILKLITFQEVLSFKADEGLLIRQARGKIRINDGKMTFIQTGVELESVAMKLNGPLDFKAKTLDLKVATKLRISRTLSTAAIASVNPVAAASMIATDTSFEFDFIDGLGEHTYTLNGSLDDPKLAEVDFDLLGKTGIKTGLKKLNLIEDSEEKTEAPSGDPSP